MSYRSAIRLLCFHNFYFKRWGLMLPMKLIEKGELFQNSRIDMVIFIYLTLIKGA